MNKNLTAKQNKLLSMFYNTEPVFVSYNKSERQKIWNLTKNKSKIPNLVDVKTNCPALYDQIKKSYLDHTNIQSAVFSECVYSQALANMLGLNNFMVADDSLKKFVKEQGIVPRYAYFDDERKKYLIQAGGCTAIDSILVDIENSQTYTIEYKEPSAKTSEPDLPKYNEDGILKVTDDFIKKYPQFKAMLKEQTGLNFFKIMGSNEHNFSIESVDMAVSENYSSIKPADVICTEDSTGILVILPSSDIPKWAKVEGEIRPAGRNPYKVWTPKALRKFLDQKGAVISDDTVSIAKNKLEVRAERGGGGQISGYKINPLFFARITDCTENGDKISFEFDKVWQLNPTIAGKMFFRNLKYKKVKNYYS